MAYLHGAYGEIGESKVASVTQADVVAAYIGTAPVNLIRGYADKDLVNMPVKVTNMSEGLQLRSVQPAGRRSNRKYQLRHRTRTLRGQGRRLAPEH